MTAQEAIALVDDLEPNQYTEQNKLTWLDRLDGQIFNEIIMTHEHEKGAHYTPLSLGEDELLVPFPYAQEMYSNYLMAQIDRANGEDARYNQSIALYNAAFNRYQAWYRREHMPLSRGRFRF